MQEDEPALGKKQQQRATVPKEFIDPEPCPDAVSIPPYLGSQLVSPHKPLEFCVTLGINLCPRLCCGSSGSSTSSKSSSHPLLSPTLKEFSQRQPLQWVGIQELLLDVAGVAQPCLHQGHP